MNSTSLYDVPLPNVLVSFVSMILCLFMFLGITGNITVIIFLKPKESFTSNESLYNLLLYYLALLDLLTCCFYIPTLIAAIVSRGDTRQQICIIAQSLGTSVASMSCVLLSMLSAERIFAVSHRRIIGKVLPSKRKKIYRIFLTITGLTTLCFMITNLVKSQFSPKYFSCFGMELNVSKIKYLIAQLVIINLH